MTPEQRQEMLERYKNMSPDEQEKAREQWGGGKGASMPHGE